MKQRQPWLQVLDQLEALLEKRPDLKSAVELAVLNAGVPEIPDLPGYFTFLENFLTRIPRHRETDAATEQFHLIVNSSPDDQLQKDEAFQQWLVAFSRDYGSYLDTPESALSVSSFTSDAGFRIEEYDPGPSGWMSFNQFFARRARPGKRPVDDLCNDAVIVSPADSRFLGCWNIDDHARLTAKGQTYYLSELLADSPFKDRFAGGLFTHSYLDTNDYHRYHTPVSGIVRNAGVIPGRVFVKETRNSRGKLETHDEVGFQFRQARGYLILESPVGLVAILPIGMGHVSSVNITAAPGGRLCKGEEFGYFCYGGSDIVMLFERNKVVFTAEINKHYKQGQRLAKAL